jgi:HemX protein
VHLFADRQFFLAAVVFYGLAVVQSIFLWRQGFRRDDFINYVLLWCGFLFHTFAMLNRGFSLARCPINNLFEATMFIGWTVVAAYLVVGLFPRLRFLGVFASPLLLGLGVFGLMPNLDDRALDPRFAHWWTSLHAALILLAYGAFGLGAVAGLMYLIQENDLKSHRFRMVFSLLPSMQRLERLVTRLILAGAILLSMGLIVGFAGVKAEFKVYYRPDPKIHWSLLVWLFYSGLLVAHFRYGGRGRRFAWASVGAFAFVMLTFWGFNLFSPLHNPPP